MKNNRFVIANWKLNPLKEDDARAIFSATKKTAQEFKKTKIIVCPPSVYLPVFSKQKISKNLSLGTQDFFWDKKGSFTGFLSIELLYQYKVSYSIIGHSERRKLGETDSDINKKVRSAIKNKVVPIICIGENNRDSQGKFLSTLREQLLNSLEGVSRKNLENVIIAYEPVWAIGKKANEVVSSTQLHESVLLIRKFLIEKFGPHSAQKPVIIYGGSVEESNAEFLLKDGHVSGFLVGRASLETKKFHEISRIVNTANLNDA